MPRPRKSVALSYQHSLNTLKNDITANNTVRAAIDTSRPESNGDNNYITHTIINSNQDHLKDHKSYDIGYMKDAN